MFLLGYFERLKTVFVLLVDEYYFELSVVNIIRCS